MSMMSQTDGPASVVAEGVSGMADGVATALERAPPPRPPEPISVRLASARALAAHVARRSRLAEQIRAQHPNFTKAEIEERLEQFGA